jgi:hypothetical protein
LNTTLFDNCFEDIMKLKLIKIAAALSLLGASAAALAANTCCGDLECCLQMLACCFG